MVLGWGSQPFTSYNPDILSKGKGGGLTSGTLTRLVSVRLVEAENLD